MIFTLKTALKIIFLFCVSFFFTQTKAQKADSGKITVIEDARVKEMQKKYIDSQDGKIKGWRVQIFFSNESAKAKEVKAKFLQLYNSKNIPAYLCYQQPYFKIRVGDFRTRLEAFKFLKEISEDFPGAFIVEDSIELPGI